MRRQWSKEIVLKTIRRLHRAGEKLNCGHIQVHQRPLYVAACVYCGSWRKAIEAAGISYDRVRIKQRVRPKWGRQNVIAAIQQLHKADEPLNSNYAQTKRQALYGAAVKYFDSWACAIKAVGLDYSRIRIRKPFRRWSQLAIVAAIRKCAAEGCAINGTVVSRKDPGLYNAARRHFGRGGWAKALRLAGYDPRDVFPLRIWTAERIITMVHALHDIGVPLYGYYLVRHGFQGLFAGGVVRFGSWKKTISAAGYRYDSVRAVRNRWWTPERVIAEIRRLERNGVSLHHRNLTRLRADLIWGAIRWFGNLRLAVEAAGIDYRRYCRTWSVMRWLKALPAESVAALETQAERFAAVRREHRRRQHRMPASRTE